MIERKLNIAYNGMNGWIYPILNELNLNEELRLLYGSDLSKFGLSISSKLDMIHLLIQEINKKITSLLNEFRANPSRVEECLKKGYGYQVNNEEDVFLLLSYMESVIFEMYSVRDLMIKYINEFMSKVLNENIDQKKLIEDLKDSGVPLEILEVLGKVRHDLIHNYAGWISFHEEPSGLRLAIELPTLKNQEFKGYQEEFLTDKTIREIFDGFRKLLEGIHVFLISRLRAKRIP